MNKIISICKCHSTTIHIVIFAKDSKLNKNGITILILVKINIEKLCLPAFFPQRKLTRDENLKLKKAFWKMFFATRVITEVEEYWLTYFMMTINLKDYFLEHIEEIRKFFRDTLTGQFEHDLLNKSFSSQLESDETNVRKRRIK